jgi:hypothetical protein
MKTEKPRNTGNVQSRPRRSAKNQLTKAGMKLQSGLRAGYMGFANKY